MNDAAIVLALSPHLECLNDAIFRVNAEDNPSEAFTAIVQSADHLYSADLRRAEAGATLSMVLAVCQLSIVSTETAAAAFWDHLPAAALMNAIALIARAHDGGYARCRDAIARISDRSSLRVRRRDALALHRNDRGDYWPMHWFVNAIEPASPRRIDGIRAVLKACPDLVGNIAQLIILTDQAVTMPPDIRANFIVNLEKSHAGKALKGWQVVFSGEALERLEDMDRAKEIVSKNYDRAWDAVIRFQLLLLMAKLQGENLGGIPQLRCLITALRVMPDHVMASQILISIHRLLKTMPNVSISSNFEKFATHTLDVLRIDSLIDLSPALQYWLLLPELLQPEELTSLPSSSSDYSLISRTVIIEEAPLNLHRLPNPKASSGLENPWDVARDLTTLQHKRAKVAALECRDVFFRASAVSTLVIASNGRLVTEASAGHASFFSTQRIIAAPCHPLNGSYISLCVAYGHFNYCHFLLDRLPRLMFAVNAHQPVDLLVDAGSEAWTRQILSGAAINLKIAAIEQDQLYKIEHVTFFSPAQHPLQMAFPGYLDFLRDLVPGWKNTRSFRRVVIHRDQGRRGIANEADFYDHMRNEGFEIVKLETLSVMQQLRLLAETEIVVGVHGAGLSNAVVCKPGAIMIEILPVGYFIPTFSIMSRACGLRYFPYLEVSEENTRLATLQQYSDTHVSIAHWAPFLMKALESC